MRAAGLAGQCWVECLVGPPALAAGASTKSASCSSAMRPNCKLARMHFLRRRPRKSLSCGCKLCNSCSCEAKISGPGSEDPIGMGPRVPDCAESVGTAMTKTIIREIQLEKLLIRCLFSESWRVIRKNLIWKEKILLYGDRAWPERYPQKIPGCTKHPRNIGLNGSQTTALTL